MSLVIVNDHPFTEKEIAYLESRNRYSEVEQNRKDFSVSSGRHAKKTETLELSPEIFDYVKNLDMDGLKSDLAAYHLDTDGKEKELRVRLAQHLQEEKDAHNS